MADNFANRSVLSGLAPNTSGSNILATAEVGEPSQSGIINSEWWSWTAPNSGTFTIDTKNSNFDTFLSVFTGSAINNLTLVGFNDDGGGNFTSLLSLNVTAGTTYQIVVDGFGNSTGSIQLNIVPVVINGTPDQDTLTGTAYPETINGLEDSDTIFGGAGNDTLNGGDNGDYLDGGPGADQLTGGSSNDVGNDIYIVDNVGDVVTELGNMNLPGNQQDGVFSSITYTLPAGIEHLQLTGTAKISGTGNNLNNTITGNSNSDTLNGGLGKDILTGGTGTNTFVFLFGESLVAATDNITDFEIGSSKIDLLTDGGAQMSAPTSFSRATNSAATTLSDVVAQVFIDANGGLAGSQALGTNSAALIVATNASIAGNYLVINDVTAGFQASKDLVIKLTTTGTFPPVGAIPVTNFFV